MGNSVEDIPAPLWQFLRQLRASSSINFPEIARDINLNWFKDIKPNLNKHPLFTQQFQEILEELKYKLHNLILQTGMNGKKKNGKDPEITYIMAVIKCIDSGVLLGAEEASGSEDTVRIKEHLKRMGLE